jgi:long-chain acyl-CoA synthetase
VLIPVTLGIAVQAVPRFNPALVLRTIRDRKVTLLIAIPSMYAALLRTKSASREHFSNVSLAISGGEPLPDAVRAGFAERFGVELLEGYGLTETSPVVAVSSNRFHRNGTVGKPIPNVEIRFEDDSGNPIDGKTDGEIFVRGPGVMKGYYNKVAQTRDVLDGEGWFRTGDIGRFDADGFLSITGRAKEMLIVGGENVFAREIETALESHDQVVQAAVIGVPDPLRGEVPVAFVIPREVDSVDEAQLRSFVKQSLAGFKIPRRVIIRSELPTGPTGKILKRKLRELL